MKTSQCQTRVSQSGNASKVTNLHSSAMSPLSTVSITLAVLLISAIPVCTSAPVVLPRATIDQDQLLSQVRPSSFSLSFYLFLFSLSFFLSLYLSSFSPIFLFFSLFLRACGCGCVNKLLPESPLCTPRPRVKRWLFMVLMFLHVGVWMRQPLMLHPLLQLVPQLDKRRGKGIRLHEDLKGPAGIQSRGYFLYRPRNGRRSLEYE
ncbi:neuromedin-U [Osmerus mordax]|uniref:neuromedin-U n=1 Tax=Osmerus mordax TaxID=8014 RepID=UPI00350FCB54